MSGDATLTVRRYVNAFCPTCHEAHPDRPLEEVRRLSGYLAEDDGRVWLIRGCPDHGRIVTLYEEDAGILDYLEQWTAPTQGPTPDDPCSFRPVPAGYRTGLGAAQTQHTCILLEDVTEVCNLSCPTCYAASGPDLAARTASVQSVLANIDRRLELEGGRLDVLMISGGEPTLHPDLIPLLDAALDRDIVRILLNTNGVTLVRDDRLLDYLAGARDRVELYLQYDGLRESTWRHHRGADLRRLKQRVLERLSAAGVFTTLVMTAARGVNDDEIGDVVLLGLETPYVGGVVIQPVFGSGRTAGIDPMVRLTHTGVLRRLGEQTGGAVTWRDLISLPCSHPHCSSVGYLLRTDAGEWRSLVALIGHERLAAHLDQVSNRIVDPALTGELKLLVGESLRGLLSNRASPADPHLRDLLADIGDVCDLGIGSLLRTVGVGNRRRLRRLAATRIKRIQVKPFMDLHTMIEERLLQCCVHVGTVAGERHQCVPFCAAQAWPALSAMKVADAAAETAVSVAAPLMRR